MIPAGLLVTVPAPVPDFVIERTYVGTLEVNVAVTVVAAFIVTIQLPVPEHPPPDQPLNILFDPCTAVKVTGVPATYPLEQVDPQLMPEGEAVTEPTLAPVPDFVTVRA